MDFHLELKNWTTILLLRISEKNGIKSVPRSVLASLSLNLINYFFSSNVRVEKRIYISSNLIKARKVGYVNSIHHLTYKHVTISIICLIMSIQECGTMVGPKECPNFANINRALYSLITPGNLLENRITYLNGCWVIQGRTGPKIF